MDEKTLEQQLNQAFDCYDIHVNVTYDDENQPVQLIIIGCNYALRMLVVKKEDGIFSPTIAIPKISIDQFKNGIDIIKRFFNKKNVTINE